MFDLNKKYTRKDVCNILHPEKPSEWVGGNFLYQGLAQTSDKKHSCLFLSPQNVFLDEFIDDKIMWWSMEMHHDKLNSIKALINNEQQGNSVHLFRRINSNDPFDYLGELKYISHSPTHSKPMLFEFRMKSYPQNQNNLLKKPSTPKKHKSKTSNTSKFDISDDYKAKEGKELIKKQKVYERDAKLPKNLKAKTLEEKGKLECECCGFDFAKVYGELGEGFIEAHHKIPVSKMDGHETTISDLALVCSNCHRMIHRKQPWKSIQDIKELISRNKLNVK